MVRLGYLELEAPKADQDPSEGLVPVEPQAIKEFRDPLGRLDPQELVGLGVRGLQV